MMDVSRDPRFVLPGGKLDLFPFFSVPFFIGILLRSFFGYQLFLYFCALLSSARWGFSGIIGIIV